ncbi:hypothetical protein RMS29_002160 [Agrobacterium rosae]|nr:hypothetical protein [Agrobacterium rosae]MCM2434022.1 hypothetical protein [Agrobacterium rosae]MDX8330419.1 hypothetical protein [Agrobacterium rosae]
MILLTAVWVYGLSGITTNSDGLAFNVVFYSVLGSIAYFVVLLLTSFTASAITSKNRFPLTFHTVLLADTVFSYALILGSSWLLSTETEIASSAGGNQGELAVNGLRTVLGWRQASGIARNAICFAIVLHFLFFIHNYIATRNQSAAEQ